MRNLRRKNYRNLRSAEQASARVQVPGNVRLNQRSSDLFLRERISAMDWSSSCPMRSLWESLQEKSVVRGSSMCEICSCTRQFEGAGRPCAAVNRVGHSNAEFAKLKLHE